MSQIQISANLRIKDGQLDAFKEMVQQCVSIVKEKDSGTLQYDWFFNSDQSVCMIKETYASSEALLEHMANLGDLLGELLATCEFEADVYGDPSEQIMAMLEGMPITFYSRFTGL